MNSTEIKHTPTKHSHYCSQCGGWYSCDQWCADQSGREFSKCLDCVRENMPESEYDVSVEEEAIAKAEAGR